MGELFNFDPFYMIGIILLAIVLFLLGVAIRNYVDKLNQPLPHEEADITVAISAMRENELVELLESNASKEDKMKALDYLKQFNKELYNKYNLLFSAEGE